MKRFYEVKVKGLGTTETGAQKPTKLSYLIKGLLFGEVEEIAANEASLCMTDIDVCAMKRSDVAEVFYDMSDNNGHEKFYRCKVVMSVFEGEKETKTKVLYLVNADSTVEAHKILKDNLGKEFDYEVSDISETKIVDVLNNSDNEDCEKTKQE